MKNIRPHLILLLIVGLLIIPLMSGCAKEETTHQTSHRSDFPAYVQNAAPRVQEAYLFAVEHPDELEYQPCYCGCGAMGHTSNRDCFVNEFQADGTVVYENHAAGCGICVDIAQDVMRLRAEGKTQPQIRQYIDGYYSAFGPSTDTPLPLG